MDLEGFEAATVPHMNALYDAALRLAGDQATAQDLTQETYLRALRSFGTFTPGTNSRAWLLRIQYNLFCTQYRRGRRMPLVWLDEGEADPALDLPSAEPGPEEETVRELDREAVRRVGAHPPENPHITVALIDIHGPSCVAAAALLSVPRGTILSRLHRARRRLEAMLLPELGRVQADDL